MDYCILFTIYMNASDILELYTNSWNKIHRSLESFPHYCEYSRYIDYYGDNVNFQIGHDKMFFGRGFVIGISTHNPNCCTSA